MAAAAAAQCDGPSGPGWQVACLGGLLALAHVAGAAAQESRCADVLFDEHFALSTHSFLDTCAERLQEDTPMLCWETSARHAEGAWGSHPACQVCREACALVLLLQAMLMIPGDMEVCSQALLPMIKAYDLLIADEGEGAFRSLTPRGIWELVDHRRIQCGKLRRRELLSLKLPDGVGGGGARLLDDASPDNSALRVGVLLAANAEMLPTYQPFINIWRCWALKHGLSLLLETDETEVRADFRPYNWMRWIAARERLRFFDHLLVVDPDQFIVPECWNVDLIQTIAEQAGGRLPDIVMRDIAPPQTLNDGVVLLKNSPAGHFFLAQLLAKMGWQQTIQHDQGAFDETVLELLGMEAARRGVRPGRTIEEDAAFAAAVEEAVESGTLLNTYDSLCSPFLFPGAPGHHDIARYSMCWWNEAERLAGGFGRRSSNIFFFLDPRVLDVNHVVGWRNTSVPAYLYHFAGKGKNWDDMLDLFGMSRPDTAYCDRVLSHSEHQARERTCVPGNSAVQDMNTHCAPGFVVC
eukprot:TRINITY_DN112553_c0_g1_i1.p1 TRINITY_DN112553_c0_g1~~TRINITY_DN112553_c0_g1_i1.p1  ORF type:complete len:523 (-),score=104.89 TRINITY_DN112553_c0_g1_i1:88-1656(-)